MNSIEQLRELVREEYEAKHEGRDEWTDWLYPNHVLPVAEIARQLADRFGAEADLAEAGALLHDLADARHGRFEKDHEEQTLNRARELMVEVGFDETATKLVVDDAVKLHACHDGRVPVSLEGKCLATADGVAHLTADFYLHAVYAKADKQSLQEVKAWLRGKLERDYNEKLLFPEVKDELAENYRVLKQLFGV